MEGILLVPPDRGTILGRAVWKPRYVVIGTLAQKDGHQPNLSLSQVLSANRIREVGGWPSKSQQKTPTDLIYLSVYKSKEDSEPIQQHSIASVSDCQVQHTAHRKGGQVLPTLVIQISPNPATDKLRKRRSSRTGGLITTKDPSPTTLWFVTAEESRHGLGDWARYIQALMRQHQQSMPSTPVSPTSPAFVCPFAPLQDTAEKPEKSEKHEKLEKSEKAPSVFSAKGKLRSKLQSKSSNRPPPPARDHSATYPSGPPSLRSRKSDISSHASSMIPAAMNFVQQHYTNLQHSELPSPASTVDEYPEQFIEGWTAAQGRTSALSSPIRGRASVSSSSQGPTNQPSLDSSPPMAPRETILDRAFQMRYIPGSDRAIAGDENLTSLARFEALMNEAESRRKNAQMKSQEPLKSTWEEDDESEEDEFGKEVDDDEDSDDYYASDHNGDHNDMGTSTRKALKFIANRHGSTYSESGLSSAPSILRPHTAHSRNRPLAQRTISQPHIPAPPLHIPSSPPLRQVEEYSVRRTHEKRHSTSDMKNMGFNEFAKRLSGTSSLLLVQSNVSGGSNRGSGDYTPRGSMSPRGTSRTPSERDESCRWRGSISVFGNEGGFL